MAVEIREQAFDPWQLLSQYQTCSPHLTTNCGATAVFVGSMRDVNEGDRVHHMSLEHYPEMTDRTLRKICDDATARWGLLDVLVVHRVGELDPGDPIVLVAVWSAHRAAAFEASRHIMEALKSTAPFWKKEMLDDGSRWVTKNTAGTVVDD